MEVWILWHTGVIIFTFCSGGGDTGFLNDSCWKHNQELWTLLTLRSQASPCLSDLTHDQMLLNLYVLFLWCIQFYEICQALLYPGGAVWKSQVIYLRRPFSLALFVSCWLCTSELNVSPNCIFPCCDTSDVYWPIASDGSLMLCCPNSLYTGIVPEMGKHCGFSHLCASPGNSRWAWLGCLLSYSLFQQRLEQGPYSKESWAKVSVDSRSKQLL